MLEKKPYEKPQVQTKRHASRLEVQENVGNATPKKPSILKEIRVILVVLCCQHLMYFYRKFHVTQPPLL